ncbi:MAG: hypothetical protein GY941_13145 [Planctomycetes bacterium]|nr:hypothetical protein [Planctomycetota bacterium]
MRHYGLLVLIAFFSSSIFAANCIPKVLANKVTVEYFDGNGNLVHTELHKVRTKKKYKGLASNGKALKGFKNDNTGKIKVKSGKLDIISGGLTTKVSKRDGTSLARIGGCSVSKLKFYSKIGKEKSPFIHKSLIEAVLKVEVQSQSNKTSEPSIAPGIPSKTPGDEGVRSQDDQAGQTLYGWLGGVNYSQSQNPLLKGAPLRYKDTQIDISVGGVTTRVGQTIKCNAVILDRTLPEIGGMSVGNLKNKTPQEVNAAFNKYSGTFLKLSDVQIYENRNQKFCIPSSVDVVTKIDKTNVKFPNVRNQYLTRAYDVIIRSAIGNADVYPHLKPVGSYSTSVNSIGYDCNMYHWSSAEAAKKMDAEFQRRNIQKLKSADVEFIGVRPILNSPARCEFDSMKVTAKKQEQIVQVTANDANQDNNLFLKSITVTVTSAKPSHLEQCKKHYAASPSIRQAACTMTGVRNTSPIIQFNINSEEIKRHNLRTSRTRHHKGYWNDGTLPGKKTNLDDLKGKDVTLLNVSLTHPRAGEYFFEDILIK